jgi:hypothetical protein
MIPQKFNTGSVCYIYKEEIQCSSVIAQAVWLICIATRGLFYCQFVTINMHCRKLTSIASVNCILVVVKLFLFCSAAHKRFPDRQ